MNGTTFDALAASKALRESGFEDRQAEAVAGVVHAGREGLATKADLDMLATRADLYRALWIQTGTIAGTIVATVGVVVAVVKLL